MADPKASEGRKFGKDEKDAVAHGDQLFTKRQPLLSLWQHIADHFYVERADFTLSRSIGEEFAAHLTTSYPLLARRELGNAFGSMLRPIGKDWFHNTTRYEPAPEDARQWLEWANGVQRRAMYDRVSQFTRATDQGDHDFAAFGQCVLTCDVVFPRGTAQLLYRTWHLRDVVWGEDAYGAIDTVHRKWKPTARDLVKLFGARVHEKVATAVNGSKPDPYCEINCRHVVIPAEGYGMAGKNQRQPFVSLYLDLDNEWVVEETPVPDVQYIIPRWQTVSGSQYAYSPATVCALPDARLIQEMTYTLLNAGQKAVDPPMVAVQEAIRSDMQIFAGGVTWVDAAYDERLGEVLRPLTQDTRAIPLGIDMAQDTRQMIAEAFFLSKLNMPARGPEMTAYEVSQRVQEYIRNALPLFGPMESDYNGQLCELTFDRMLRHGAFGSPMDMPRALRGAETQFRFESPLHDALESQKGQKFLETKALLAEAAPLDPLAVRMVDARKALRDALDGIGSPAAWRLTDEQMAEVDAKAAQEQEVQKLLGAVSQGAAVAQQVGDAGQALAGAKAAETGVGVAA